MNYAIVGSGAVGGFYGGKLFAAGKDVSFLYHSEYEAVRAQGLRIRSPLGNLELRVPAYKDAADMPKADVIIGAPKPTQTAARTEILAKLAKPGGVVLCLQNGLGNEEAIAETVGRRSVLGGSAFICSERGAPGEVLHYAEGGLSYGPYFDEGKAKLAPICEAIAADFRDAAVPSCKVLASGRDVKWSKLIWNIPYSGGSLYYGAVPTDKIAGNPKREAFVSSLMREIADAAERDGAHIPPELPRQNLEATRKMGAYKPSLLVDYEKGRPMEIGCIIEEPLRRGLAAGLPMTNLSELLRGIRAFLEKAAKA